MVGVLDFGHSNGCEVVSFYYGLHFPMTYEAEHLLYKAYAHVASVSSLVNGLLRSLAHFLNTVGCFLLVDFSMFFVYFG